MLRILCQGLDIPIHRFQLNNQPRFFQEDFPEANKSSNIFINGNWLSVSQGNNQKIYMPNQPNLVDGQPFYRMSTGHNFKVDLADMAANQLYLKNYQNTNLQLIENRCFRYGHKVPRSAKPQGEGLEAEIHARLRAKLPSLVPLVVAGTGLVAWSFVFSPENFLRCLNLLSNVLAMMGRSLGA
uniref:Uncharacterized protein n=1 Tax=Caulerpa manorensis TaxID=717648 RepID=A0A2P0QIB4_9CHLO|nr:hypothetical protein [Caulerpa manorensis]ARO74491.1 hypothetical protein [Caulerpa manorensis]